jgi:iron complex outermembrane receptor protein
LTGAATAADGAHLPGVTLRLFDDTAATDVIAVSSDAGVFRIPNLLPGTYQLRAELPGFEPRQISGIVLASGASVSVDVRLDIAAVRETVRVVGEARRDTVESVEMRESRARDVGEALAVLPGVTRVRKGAIANEIVMRGFQGKDVTVLIDGQRVDGACPGHMDPPAFHVDFAEVSRVEASRGPFDVKNQGGLAGVVNIVTDRPQHGWHGAANVTVASASTLAASASASLGRERWSALGGVSRREADPYRDGGGVRLTDRGGYRPGAIDGVPAYDVWTAWGRVSLVPREAALLQISYTRQSADTILYPYLQMDARFDNADRAGARFEASNLPGGWQTFAARAYYTRVDHWMTDELRLTGAGKAREYSMGTRADTAIAGGGAELQRGAFTVGVEASRREWNARTMLAMQNYAPQASLADVSMNVGGGFLTYSIDPAPSWRIEAGARLDRAISSADPALVNSDLFLAYHGTRVTEATDVLPTGYVRARWRGDTGLSALAGVGHSARLPDQQERFYALKRMGSDWVGNPLLDPSRNTGFDGELRYRRHAVDLGVSAFLYRVDDAIRIVERTTSVRVPGIMNTAARSFANIDALARGFEANATVPLAPSLFASADLSMVRSTTRGTTAFGENLPEIPPARLRVRLRYDHRSGWNAAAEAVASARQDRVAIDLRETPTPAFSVVNMRGGWRARRLTVTAAIDNLFDTAYAEHLSYQRDPFRNAVRVYEPGRTASIDLGVRF